MLNVFMLNVFMLSVMAPIILSYSLIILPRPMVRWMSTWITIAMHRLSKSKVIS
jgi:hypothetical protein